MKSVEQSMHVYIGTYTRSEAHDQPSVAGIYQYQLDAASGALHQLGTTGGLANPSFLTIDPTGRFLYTVQEVEAHNGAEGGAVSAFAIDSNSGDLTLINSQSTHGKGPCYLSLDQHGRWLLVANYSSGSICVLPVGERGGLNPATSTVHHRGSGVDPQRQQGPHAHAIIADPTNRFVLATDLGLDKILMYQLDGTAGVLAPHDPAFAPLPPGSGPRHLAFHPSGEVLYCINELNSTISGFKYDAKRGELSAIQTLSTLPHEWRGANSCAHIAVHPSGRYLYGSNRGHDSIALFGIDLATGLLSALSHTPTGGRTPRNFAMTPSGDMLLVANQDSNTAISFRIDESNGALIPTGASIAVPSPVCVAFAPATIR